jgi:hypothetical protein
VVFIGENVERAGNGTRQKVPPVFLVEGLVEGAGTSLGASDRPLRALARQRNPSRTTGSGTSAEEREGRWKATFLAATRSRRGRGRMSLRSTSALILPA